MECEKKGFRMQIKQIQTNLANLILLQQIVLDHLKSIGNVCQDNVINYD
jgi:hypothetical protein